MNCFVLHWKRIKEMKDKNKRIHMRTRFRDNYDNRSPATAPEMLVGVSYRKQRNLQAHGYIIVALHPEVFRVSYFHKGTDVYVS